MRCGCCDNEAVYRHPDLGWWVCLDCKPMQHGMFSLEQLETVVVNLGQHCNYLKDQTDTLRQQRDDLLAALEKISGMTYAEDVGVEILLHRIDRVARAEIDKVKGVKCDTQS